MRPDEVDVLAEISRETFVQAFGAMNDPKDIAAYVGTAFTAISLSRQMEAAGTQFHFAEREGAVLGYLKTNTGPAQNERFDVPSLEVERIYVLPGFQGQGVGRDLLAAAMARARREGAARVWLGVWEHNTAARAFYWAQGFTDFGQHPFQLGADLQTDILMQKPV